MIVALLALGGAAVASHASRGAIERDRLEAAQLLHEMQTAAPRVQAWQAQHPDKAPPAPGESFLVRISRSAQAHALPLARSDGDPDGAVRIELKAARLDHVLVWFDDLDAEGLVRFDRVSIEPTEASGLVDVGLKVSEESGQ